MSSPTRPSQLQRLGLAQNTGDPHWAQKIPGTGSLGVIGGFCGRSSVFPVPYSPQPCVLCVCFIFLCRCGWVYRRHMSGLISKWQGAGSIRHAKAHVGLSSFCELFVVQAGWVLSPGRRDRVRPLTRAPLVWTARRRSVFFQAWTQANSFHYEPQHCRP